MAFQSRAKNGSENYFRWIFKKLPGNCDSRSKRRYYESRLAAAQARNGLQLHNGTTQAQKQQPVPLQCAEPFEPNHRRYRTCCCHSKSFTITFGVIELFIICFILVAVVPDFNTKICGAPPPPNGQQPEEQRQQFEAVQEEHAGQQPVDPLAIMGPTPEAPGEAKANTDSPNAFSKEANESNGMPNTGILQKIIARKRRQAMANEVQQHQTMGDGEAQTQQGQEMAQLGPIMPAVDNGRPQIVLGANETKPENNSLLLLHNTICDMGAFWLCWASAQMVAIALLFLGIRRQRWQLLIPHVAATVWLVIICLIGAFLSPGSMNLAGHLILLVFLFVLFLWISLLLKAELRCAEFVKRSAETGFSICRTRPIGPPTVSQSDERERRAGSANLRTKAPGEDRSQAPPTDVNQRDQTNTQSVVTEMTQTRPSTAASSNIANDHQKQQQLTAWHPMKGSDSMHPDNPSPNTDAETVFGFSPIGSKLAQRRAMPIGLPPLRHTFRA